MERMLNFEEALEKVEEEMVVQFTRHPTSGTVDAMHKGQPATYLVSAQIAEMLTDDATEDAPWFAALFKAVTESKDPLVVAVRAAMGEAHCEQHAEAVVRWDGYAED